MQPCFQIGAYAGFSMVMRGGPWGMLNFAGWCDLAGQRPAIVKELLWCYWRWDRMLRSVHIFCGNTSLCLFFGKSVSIYVLTFGLQDYEKACGAFLEGVKLEPGNAEIKEGLRYPTWPFWLHSSLVSSDNCLTMIFFVEQPKFIILTVRTEICREALESLKISGSSTGKDLLDHHQPVGTVN
jgi:hypothetical protein